MEKETSVLNRIKERFPTVDTDAAVVKTRRIYLSVPEDIFDDALRFAAGELKFDHLCTITGIDNGTNYEFLYHISNRDGILMTLKRMTGREDPVVIPSVLPVYPGATFYERELEGLLGIKVDGLPEGRQYPLPDNWPKGEFPMRKGWTPKKRGEAQEEEKA